MKIKDFFNSQPSNDTTAARQQQTVSQPSQKSQLETVIKKKINQAPSTPVPVSDTMITINLHIEKPDIILLEDMDDINSNCIVLNVSNNLPHKNELSFDRFNSINFFTDGNFDESKTNGRAPSHQWIYKRSFYSCRYLQSGKTIRLDISG